VKNKQPNENYWALSPAEIERSRVAALYLAKKIYSIDSQSIFFTLALN